MTTTLSPNPIFRSWDNSGNPLVGGQLFTYAAGTTTPLATFTDSTGSTPNTNPVILNSRGEASVWLPPNTAFKLALQDSLGNGIWTVDQVVNAQLITLYGGVDTGVANAYVLTFAASFTSYTDGIIVYWIPANANTGPSTININGIGVINLVNQNGSPLVAGQITANQVVSLLIKGGQALLINNTVASSVLAVAGSSSAPSISFAGDPLAGWFFAGPGAIGFTLDNAVGQLSTGLALFGFGGFSGSPTANARYFTNGLWVVLRFPEFSATSNATTFTASISTVGLPFPSPVNSRQWIQVAAALDNGAAIYSQVAYVETIGFPTNTLNIHFAKNGNVNGWTASGNKGLGDGSSGVDSIVMAFMLI